MTAHDDAKKAAEAATRDRAVAYDLTDVEHRRFVRDAVDAAAPILLAAERARIAAAIREAHKTAPDCCAYDTAARIAETAPEACRCAGHYMACDEACPDFWLPDVPMSPDKGHAASTPEEGQ